MRRGAGGGQRAAGRAGVALVSFVVIAILAWAVVYPNVRVIAGTFENGLADWRAFFASPADREATLSTVIIAVGSVVAAVLVGLPLAFLLTRFDFRGRRLLGAVEWLPAALPPLVGVLAFIFLYGESGVVTR